MSYVLISNQAKKEKEKKNHPGKFELKKNHPGTAGIRTGDTLHYKANDLMYQLS